jgi:hypothetical protein
MNNTTLCLNTDTIVTYLMFTYILSTGIFIIKQFTRKLVPFDFVNLIIGPVYIPVLVLYFIVDKIFPSDN